MSIFSNEDKISLLKDLVAIKSVNGNEIEVATYLKDVLNKHQIEAEVIEVKNSLEAFQTDYIDLYLIHHPWDNDEEMVATWKVLEKHAKAGTLKSIGVSNFSKEQLQLILDNATIKPTVNQIKSHPGEWKHEVI